MWQTTKKTNVTKLGMWQNLECDKTQKPKMRQNSITQNVTKLTNKKCDTTQKLKM